ncbi:hypothetical+protein [Methylocapsa aurea]
MSEKQKTALQEHSIQRTIQDLPIEDLPIEGSPLEERRDDSRRKTFLTMGGCSTYEAGQRLSPGLFRSRGHLWRRPTIALVSEPIKKIDSRFSCLPAEFLTYFVNDAKKLHLPNLLEIDAELLIFDLTRDLRAGILALDENQFVLDPLEGIGIVEGLTPETMNQEIFEKAFKDSERISFHADWRRFFPLWKRSFARMIEILSTKFSHIMLLEHYFTSKVNGVPYTYDFAPGAAETCNIALEKMYDFARGFESISFVSLPRKLFITGREVPWGGPSDTHYLPEVYLLYAEKIAQQTFRNREDGSQAIIDQLFDRAAERDHLIVQIQSLTEERDQRTTENAIFCAERDQASSEREEMRAERDAAVSDSLAFAADRDRIAVENAAFLAERDIALRERDAVLARLDLALANSHAFAADRGRIVAENAAFLAERDLAFREKEEMRAERDAAVTHSLAFAADRDRIAAESDAERDRLIREKDEIEARLDAALSHCHAFAADRDRIAAESAVERDAAFAERDRLAMENAAHLAARELAAREIDEIIARLDAALAHGEELTADRDRLAAERDEAFRALRERASIEAPTTDLAEAAA